MTTSMDDLSAFAQMATQATSGMPVKAPPPVHLWNPRFCGTIDMRIAQNGTWFYQGTPIVRPAMVKLFASILRKDPERYVLVTPVEMVEIIVEDAPFMAVEMQINGNLAHQELAFRTNVDDWTVASRDHPLRFESEETGGLKPYIHVRGDLWAKATRAVYMEIVNAATEHVLAGEAVLGIESSGAFFPIAPAKTLSDIH
jgi:uncharacterized protein